MRILSWNILQGGGKRAANVAKTIVDANPDVVILQEFRHGSSRSVLQGAMESAGLVHVYVPEPESNRSNTLAAFSRLPMQGSVFSPSDDPSPATALAIDLQLQLPGDSELSIIGVHLPHKKKQLPYWNALLALDPASRTKNSLVVGDFNCGIPFQDSETKTFYATQQFQSFLQQGWIDSWRSRHPKEREFSWISTRKGNGFRYDHALASPKLDAAISSIEYDHQPRELGISDHSLITIDINDERL